jgi:hypothetical protein
MRIFLCRNERTDPREFLEDFPAELVEEWNVGNENPWSDDEPF